MPHTSKLALIATGIAVATTIGASAAAHRSADPAAERRVEAAFTATHRGDVRISQARAERLARRARPGTAFDAHLEDEGHGLRWEVKTDDGRRVWEVQLDPDTGAVVSEGPDA